MGTRLPFSFEDTDFGRGRLMFCMNDCVCIQNIPKGSI